MNKKLALGVLVGVPLVVFLTATTAFAQGITQVPAVGAVSTLALAVTVASILFGVVSTALNTGKLLGRFQVSSTALVWLGIVAPFLAGVLAYLKTASDFSAQVLLYAVLQGLLDVALGAAPSATVAFAVHAHITLPARLRALRALPAANSNATPPPAAPPAQPPKAA